MQISTTIFNELSPLLTEGASPPAAAKAAKMPKKAPVLAAAPAEKNPPAAATDTSPRVRFGAWPSPFYNWLGVFEMRRVSFYPYVLNLIQSAFTEYCVERGKVEGRGGGNTA